MSTTAKTTEHEQSAARVILKVFNDDPITSAIAARLDRGTIVRQLACIINTHNTPLHERIKSLEAVAQEVRSWGRHAATCCTYNPEDEKDFDESRCSCYMSMAKQALPKPFDNTEPTYEH